MRLRSLHSLYPFILLAAHIAPRNSASDLSIKNLWAGLDEIHAANVKLVANKLSLVIAYVINNIFRSGIFQSELKKGKVVPVHKKGDRGVLNTHRTITILIFSAN